MDTHVNFYLYSELTVIQINNTVLHSSIQPSACTCHVLYFKIELVQAKPSFQLLPTFLAASFWPQTTVPQTITSNQQPRPARCQSAKGFEWMQCVECVWSPTLGSVQHIMTSACKGPAWESCSAAPSFSRHLLKSSLKPVGEQNAFYSSAFVTVPCHGDRHQGKIRCISMSMWMMIPP